MSNLLLLLQAFLAPLISPLELLLDALSQALTRFLSENGVLLTDLLDVSDVRAQLLHVSLTESAPVLSSLSFLARDIFAELVGIASISLNGVLAALLCGF